MFKVICSTCRTSTVVLSSRHYSSSGSYSTGLGVVGVDAWIRRWIQIKSQHTCLSAKWIRAFIQRNDRHDRHVDLSHTLSFCASNWAESKLSRAPLHKHTFFFFFFFKKWCFNCFHLAVAPVKHVHWGRRVGGRDALMGNLVVCLAGNRRRKQTAGSGGFTASWCIHLRGGTIPPAQPWLILTGHKEAVGVTNLLLLRV